MSIFTDIQLASSSTDVPDESDIEDWIRATLKHSGHTHADLTVRIVDEAEITSLNQRYRQRNLATDVLSFCYRLPVALDERLLGDVVVCADVINREASSARIQPQAHWARIIAHGVLHLCGYDHQQPQEASVMESAEGSILSFLGLHHPELHDNLL